MKKLLTSFAAFTALTTVASAADLPRRAAPPIFTPVPVFTWTGFYAGINAGYGFGVQDSRDPTLVATIDPRVISGVGVGGFAYDNGGRQDGFVGGAQIGYNYQFTPGSGIVVGIEADAQYADLGGRDGRAGTCGVAGVACAFTGTAALQPGVTLINPTGLQGLDFFGTVRGRIGYAFDRVLFYGTGGFAYGSFGGGRAVDADDFKTGYAVGGGVEYALPTDSFLNFFRSSAVTLKIEGLYVNFDGNQSRYGFANANGTIVNATPLPNFNAGTSSVIFNNFARRDNDFAVVRAGLNYKFGSY
ncbi:outer membrane immunogenic protein [Methylorubrum rhodinum]|jgi:outer membrane immunogenic protein|uniref:Outer membrane immunogenic protein n=1 Tax=Methylorubrum rhodinum TaxID=29428 RepID=A0A840ZK97_9HYPH|nr:porin family protein [Methylorubrum rhodinum]MBB5757564.1 outer membrane immunogenic protein [Methylorubrum rhodinum]